MKKGLLFILGVLTGWAITWVRERRRQDRYSTVQEATLIAQLAGEQKQQIQHQALLAAAAEQERLQQELIALQQVQQQASEETGQLRAELAAAQKSAAIAAIESGRWKAALESIGRTHAVMRADHERLQKERAATESLQFSFAELQEDYTNACAEINQLRVELALTHEAHAEQELLSIEAGASSPPGAIDPLIDITGIGPVYQRRLQAAGITTFAQLAAQTPERLRELTSTESWQAVDPAAWIAEARQRVEATQHSGHNQREHHTDQ